LKKLKKTANIGELFPCCHNVHRAVRCALGTGPRQATGQMVPAQIPYLARHIKTDMASNRKIYFFMQNRALN
jgi:hypothetical protein